MDSAASARAAHAVAPPGDSRARVGTWLVVSWFVAALPLALLRGLGVEYAWPLQAYVPVHALVEIAIVLIGFATFAVQWYAAGVRGASDARARFVGSAFLGVGVLHAVHLLVFPGMPGVFGPSAVERGIYYLLLGRIWLAGALLASAFIPRDADNLLLRRGPLLVANLAALAAGAALELPLGVLYQPGTGLTAAKIGLEFVLAGMALVGAVLHWRSWQGGKDRAALRTSAALGLVVLSELAFASFSSVHDVYNLAGHLYSVLSVAIMFDTLFATAILDPYRRLEVTTRDLAGSNARLDALRAHVEGELASTIARLRDASANEQRARAELEAAIAAVPDGIVVYSLEGRILRTNLAAERLLGVAGGRSGESVLQRWSRLRVETPHGKSFAVEENPIVKALQGETVPGVPASVVTLEGKRLWISVGAAPMRGADGRLEGAVASFTDIGAIQELQAQRDDLLRAVSHDLRNPLQIVLLQAERLQRLLKDTDLPKEKTSADRIVHAAKQMGIMIRDLVEAARMESGTLVLAVQEVDIGAFLPRLLAQSAGALDTGRVRLEVPPALPRAAADPARLERILVNLIGNALKYSPGGGEVRVTAAAQGGELVLSVTDRGPGIDPEDAPRLFDRFYRGQRTQGAEGLGLGLYIVQMLVQAHRGRVWVDSRPGEGATFRFTLPSVG
jgi:PAS domain S-box-containing protein